MNELKVVATLVKRAMNNTHSSHVDKGYSKWPGANYEILTLQSTFIAC